MKLKAKDVARIKQIGQAILQANRPYMTIAIDTASDLEDMCLPLAEQIYSGTSMGKYWFVDKNGIPHNKDYAPSPENPAGGASKALKREYGSIINLPEGAGYQYLRQAFESVYNYTKTWAPRTILSCHVKDIKLDDKNKVVNAMSLDLTGKIKKTVASKADAIGYMFRRGNQNILSFKTSDTIACGARSEHLRNQEIVISEYDQKTKAVTCFWDRIYLPELA